MTVAALLLFMASVVGAAAVLFWAGNDAAGAASTMAALPGIDPPLIAEAAQSYHAGPLAILAGSFGGIPFKLFALEAAKEGSFLFLLLAPLVRLPRFLAIALFVGGTSRVLQRWMTVRQRLALLLALWIVFYGWYFSVMPH